MLGDLPWLVAILGLVAHWEYFGLLSAFPFIAFPSIPPFTSLGMLFAHNWIAYDHFTSVFYYDDQVQL